MTATTPHTLLRAIGLVGVFVAAAASAQGPHVSLPPELDARSACETVESVAAVIEREYVDADVAARVGASLRRGVAEGRFRGGLAPDAFAALVNRDLYAVTHDKHLAVAVVPEAGPQPDAAGAGPDEARETIGRRSNFGVQTAEVLLGNVGYLRLTSFYRPNEAAEAIASAMRLLQNAEALVLDLRGNLGGSPDTAALVASYFLDAPGLELFEIVPRSGGGAQSYRSLAPLPAEHNARRPLLVLTSKETFSAGEGLAFLLQERRRAEVIGETTAGAANPGRSYPVNARFSVNVPNGRVRSAVGGGNWEGVGVVPDVPVPASDALRVAHARALRALLARAPAGSWHDAVERNLRALEGQPANR